MQNHFDIKSIDSQDMIEFFKLTSERGKLILSLIESPQVFHGDKIFIPKEVLKQKIEELISKRSEADKVDFGNRFDESMCYQTMEFENQLYKLQTSGIDNLIIFLLNLYNHPNSTFAIFDSQ